MSQYTLGKDCKVYVSATALTSSAHADSDITAALAAGTTKEVNLVIDNTINSEHTQADTSCRASDVETTASVSRKLDFNFNINWLPGDAAFDLLQAAHDAKTVIFAAALDKAQGVTGAQGPVGNFQVTKFSRKEPYKGTAQADVEIKPYQYCKWFKAT